MLKSSLKSLCVALGASIAIGLAFSPAYALDSKKIEHGYKLAESHDAQATDAKDASATATDAKAADANGDTAGKDAEGKCADGKCSN